MRKQYDLEQLLDSEEMHDAREKLFESYLSVNSIEFYPNNILENGLNQIAYTHAMGLINSELAAVFLDQMQDLVNWMLASATKGERLGPDGKGQGRYVLYQNEIILPNTLLLAENEPLAMVFATIDHPNFIMTTDKKVVEHIRFRFKQLKNRSINISQSAEKHRLIFFNHLTSRIEEMKNRLLN